ncbi:MAG: motility associated factor glycosyltransferase family protein [Rhodospirillales bacterium]|nr:motility associated factor glycosyltransferase family protein [Rhodospirillales bacterium]
MIDAGASENAFKAAFPQAWSRFVAGGPPLARIVWDAGQAINLDLGEGTLYPFPASEWTRQRLAEFRAAPERIGFSDPSHCNLSAVSMPLLDRLTAYIRERGLTASLQGLPVADVGYLFVFGVGLGQHVAELVAETPARHIVLIEPVAEFVRHACAVIDWADVLAVAAARGVTLHLCLESDPEAICAFCEALVSREGNTFLEGSCFHPHYYSWALKHAYALMRERLKVHALSTGFFEDEVEMARNCHANLARWPFHLVESRLFRAQTLPVFIVGAGPSLDVDLPVIRRWRERALLVSCGTTLGILLKHGLRPDIHVELERGALVFDLLAAVEREHGFAGITLLASTTVDPRIGGLFEKRWLFFRSGLSPAVLLRGSAEPLHGADPLCCNAAFAAIANLGFREIYFFGLDLAQKETGRHHARDSLYYKDEHADLDEMYRKRFNRPVPGNFGGIVETFWAFDSGRQMLARVQRIFSTQLFNCSDGARIDGARPKAAASVRLAAPSLPRLAVLRNVEAQLRSLAAGEMLDVAAFGGHAAGCATFIPAFAELIRHAAADAVGFVELEGRLHAFVARRRPEFAGFFSLGLSSLLSMLRLGAFFASRIPDATERQTFFVYFLELYLERATHLAKEAEALLRSFDAGQPADRPDAPLASLPPPSAALPEAREVERAAAARI